MKLGRSQLLGYGAAAGQQAAFQSHYESRCFFSTRKTKRGNFNYHRFQCDGARAALAVGVAECLISDLERRNAVAYPRFIGRWQLWVDSRLSAIGLTVLAVEGCAPAPEIQSHQREYRSYHQ